MTGAPALRGEKGYTPLERIWARPTAEVNGIGRRYRARGPRRSCRARPWRNSPFALCQIRTRGRSRARPGYFHENAPPSVRLDIVPGHSGEPYLVDPHAGFGVAAQKALGRLFPGKKAGAHPRGRDHSHRRRLQGHSSCGHAAARLLPARCNAHSPNETFPLEHLDLGANLNRYLLEEIAGLGPVHTKMAGWREEALGLGPMRERGNVAAALLDRASNAGTAPQRPSPGSQIPAMPPTF